MCVIEVFEDKSPLFAIIPPQDWAGSPPYQIDVFGVSSRGRENSPALDSFSIKGVFADIELLEPREHSPSMSRHDECIGQIPKLLNMNFQQIDFEIISSCPSLGYWPANVFGPIAFIIDFKIEYS